MSTRKSQESSAETELTADPPQVSKVSLDNQIWPMRTVVKLTSLGQSQIYAEIHDGTFPAPLRLSKGRVGWVASEVLAWISERKAERDRLLAQRKAEIEADN